MGPRERPFDAPTGARRLGGRWFVRWWLAVAVAATTTGAACLGVAAIVSSHEDDLLFGAAVLWLLAHPVVAVVLQVRWFRRLAALDDLERGAGLLLVGLGIGFAVVASVVVVVAAYGSALADAFN